MKNGRQLRWTRYYSNMIKTVCQNQAKIKITIFTGRFGLRCLSYFLDSSTNLLVFHENLKQKRRITIIHLKEILFVKVTVTYFIEVDSKFLRITPPNCRKSLEFPGPEPKYKSVCVDRVNQIPAEKMKRNFG